jgi:putative hemolysin
MRMMRLSTVSEIIILRTIGIKPSGIDSSDDPLREILGIAKAAAIKNKISREQEGIIVNTARLIPTKLYQIMVKRIDMKGLTANMALAEALVASHVNHHTRFPLTDNPSEEIVGYVNFKDIVNTLRINPANPSLRGICRPMISFKENDTINNMLRRLITTHQHIALRNAENKVTGMVTMEDILETIVGDIQDGYDRIPDYFYEISPGYFVSGGGLALKKKMRLMSGNSFPDDERTVDLWIREQLGTNIKADTTLSHDAFSFIIRKVSRSHVYEIIIVRT